MRYTYGEGVEKQKSSKWPFALLGLVLIAGYLYANVKSPIILAALDPSDATANKLTVVQPKASDNRLYIPKINLDAPIASASSDETDALSRGAIQRSPLSGDPVNGGNYVLAAHRFSLSINPLQTGNQSLFYNLAKLSTGDDLFVDYKGVRYAYRVMTRTSMDAAVESRTNSPYVTLYGVESEKNGKRDVVTAQFVGHVVWTSGQPKIKPADILTDSTTR